MFKHFFLIFFRNFRKQRSFSLINVIGLALGIACSLLIGLFIHFEFSFDRFHEKADRIYRVFAYDDSEDSFFSTLTHISGKLGESYQTIPDIEQCVRLRPAGAGTVHVFKGKKRFAEETILAADSTFFELFDFPLVMGSRSEVLSKKHQIVISESLAKRCFGDESPIGQRISLQAKEATQDYLVAGVMADFPSNTHIHADAVVPFENYLFFNQSTQSNPNFRWGNLSIETFILTRQAVSDYDQTGEQISSLLPEDISYKMGVQPITDIRLRLEERGPDATTNTKSLFTFALIACIIMLIACINFMNLNTARASTRKLEIGVRKVLGARQQQLAIQFLGEAFLHSLIAMLVALLLVDMSLPLIRLFFDFTLNIKPLFSTNGLFSLAVAWVVISLLAGIYPSIFLSRLQAEQLRSLRHASSKGGGNVRKVLVVAQFCASIILILSTLVIYRQMDFAQNKDLGYEKEQLIDIELVGAGSKINLQTLTQQFETLPIVQSAALSSFSMGRGAWLNIVNLVEEPERKEPIFIIAAEPGYVETMGFNLKAGHGFRKDHITDRKAGFVVNEAFVQKFGLSSPIGTEVVRNDQQGKIIGVIKDFHFQSVKSKVFPSIIFSDTSQYQSDTYTKLIVKLKPGDMSKHLATLSEVWTSMYPDRPFSYQFQDEVLANFYKSEARLGKLMGVFSLLAVIIASLGLLGLITFTATQRTKEIGVRKVMGASVQDIILLLTRSYAGLLGIAFLIAIPLGGYLMHNWLEGFAYRISLEGWIFGVSGMLAALIAGLTAGLQSYRAATINPADALRDE